MQNTEQAREIVVAVVGREVIWPRHLRAAAQRVIADADCFVISDRRRSALKKAVSPTQFAANSNITAAGIHRRFGIA